MPIVDNLFIKLGYKYDPKNMEKFNEIAKGTARSLKVVSFATIGLATSFTLLFAKISSNALVQQRFGKAMGVSRDAIAAFARTSEELTGERGTAGRFIEQFNGIQNALKAGIAPSDAFLRSISMMGVSLEDFQNLNPDKALLRLAGGFQALDKDQQDAVTSLLSLDSAGRNLFAGLTESKLKANMPSPADLKSIEEFDQSLLRLKKTFNDAIVTFGTPLFKELIPALDTLKQNMPAIIGFARDAARYFKDFGEAIGESIGFAVVKINELTQAYKRLIAPISGSEYQSPENKFSGLTGFVEGFAKQELGLFGGTSNSSSSSNVTQNFDINITGDNAQNIAQKVIDIGREQMSQAQNNISTQVAN